MTFIIRAHFTWTNHITITVNLLMVDFCEGSLYWLLTIFEMVGDHYIDSENGG